MPALSSPNGFKVQGKRWWFKSFKTFNRFAPFKTFLYAITESEHDRQTGAYRPAIFHVEL
jgi:hypothetical protein